jgi:electron transfer flavoprotein beta subunit
LKICVLVKEVPDAAVEKRIDPSTGRMDRSGERNLNPYDTHAIEAAMQIREGGAVEVDEIVAVTMGPSSATRALQKAVSLGADRSLHLSDCERQAEYGYDTVEVTLPAVISVGDAINEPRYPSLKAIMGAKKKPLETVAAGDVGIDASLVGADGSRVQCGEFKDPPAKAAGTIIEDEDTDDTVEKIVAWLDERKLI